MADRSAHAIRVGFVLHVMQVAGAEVLVAETIRRLGAKIDPVVLCLDSVGQLGEVMQSEGVPVIAYGRRPGIDWSVSKRMAADVQARGIDVLHAHQYTPFFYGALASRLARPRAKVIFTEHGRHYPDAVGTGRRMTNRLVFRHLADRINAVCDFSARALAERDGFDPKTIQVIPNGIEVCRYSRPADPAAARQRLGLDSRRRYVTCVARFHPVKDHQTLLRAFALVAKQRPDTDLLLVGDGPLRATLESQVADLDLSGRVRFLGVRDDVADILPVSDVFTLTSVSEAASITLLEAMAAGLPVVVTAVGGNPEIVRDNVDGLLAPRGDANAIASSLSRVLDEPDLARRFGDSGARRVRESFRLDDTIGKYYALYEELTDNAAQQGKAH